MIKFINQEFDEKNLHTEDIFICAFGYESRSIALYERIKTRFSSDNILVFVFDDYKCHVQTANYIEQIINERKTATEIVKYEDAEIVCQSIQRIIHNKMECNDMLTVHIDYSSMPRKWYSRLPILLKEQLREGDQLFFWYMTGIYLEDYEEYSAGIDSFSVLGCPSLRSEAKRTHIIGLSYDAVRTDAMLSILDPDSYVVCNAYNKNNMEIGNNVHLKNEVVISRASMEISLQIDDFSFMISKLCELACELLPLGDVIFIPDGPKPLIFAMSLVPLLLRKSGVTCLHVSRNREIHNNVDVKPANKIYGFTVIE